METSVRGAEAFDELAGDWSRLCEQDPAATVFHTPEYLRVWMQEFGDAADVRFVEARRGGDLVALAPVALSDGVVRFAGDPEITDYLGPVSRPADRDEAASALIAAVAGLEWGTAELRGLAADSGWPEAVDRAAKEAGLEADQSQEEVCPRIAIGASYEAYLEALPGKLRHEIRRKARRLERELGPFTLRTSVGENLEAELEIFYGMHRSSKGPKGKFLHPGMASYFTALARAASAAGWLRLVWLERSGTPVAGMYGFSRSGVWSAYNSAYEHTLSAVAPGMVLASESVRLAAEEGCATFDLLRGSEEYKYRLGAADAAVVRTDLRRA